MKNVYRILHAIWMIIVIQFEKFVADSYYENRSRKQMTWQTMPRLWLDSLLLATLVKELGETVALGLVSNERN